jgi:hypothetical protein
LIRRNETTLGPRQWARIDDAILSKAPRSRPAPDATAAAVEDPAKWVSDSERLAEQFIYTPAIGDGAGPFALTDAYQARRETDCEAASDACGSEARAIGQSGAAVADLTFRVAGFELRLVTQSGRPGTLYCERLLCAPIPVIEAPPSTT